MASDEDSPVKSVGFTDTDLSHQSEDFGRYQHDGSFHFNFGQGTKDDMPYTPERSRDWKNVTLTSPGPEEVSRLRLENNQLRLQLKQLTADLQTEQDTVGTLRKRLNMVERDRLEAATKFNTEVSEFESQIAKLRANLEKGEASKANIEFELTKSRRDLAQQKHAASSREKSLEEANTELKEKLVGYGDEIRRLEEALQHGRNSHEERERQLKQDLQLKEQEVSSATSDNEAFKSEKEKLNLKIQQQESTISELNDKLQDLENDRKQVSENLRRTGTELEYCKEREERGKKDLESTIQRLRSLEESVESERAAHLETKFNSEIVQLRVRDLEGALDVEKSANTEANKAIDRLSKQIKELETSYEDERKINKQTTEKLAKLEKEHSNVRKQLTNEVENKKTTISNLSKELEVHQKNFIELKEELSKARKRQIYLEETYGGSMRELELLLQNFQISDSPPVESKKRSQHKGKDSKSGSKNLAPSVVLESLRLTLADYRKRLDNTSEELNKMKKSSSSLNKEVESCKEMIWAKDRALEDAQKSYTRTAKELNRVRSEYGELETLLTRLKVDMQSTASNQSKDRTRIQELSEEIMKLVKKHKSDEEEKLAFLHGLYQRLLAGKVPGVTTDKPPFTQLAWHELTNMVYDQVAAMLNALQNADEKVSQLETALRTRESGWQEEHASHEDQLNKLSSLTKDREIAWQKQKSEMEQHYQQLLSEMQSRIKKSQSVADQAWEKVRMTSGVQQGLESECSDLQTKMAETKKQNASLLACCSMLIGAFYPLCSRSNMLALQRRIMEDQLNNWEVCRERVELLVHTLTSEMNKSNDQGKEAGLPRRSGALVFRSAAVAVLAANRLRRLGEMSVRTFVTHDSATGQNNLLVCTGQSDTPVRDTDRGDETGAMGESGLCQWLTSSELLHTLTSSTSELCETLNQVQGKHNLGAVEKRAVVNAARNSFTRLFDRLGRYYETMSLRPDVGFRERNSLIRMLGRGLNKVLRNRSPEEIGSASPQELMIGLQSHILEFTQRLHGVEVERRGLLQEVSQLQDQLEARDGEMLEEQRGQDVAVSQQGNRYVPIEKFESVCIELNNALKREEQGQSLLQEQSRQMEELSARMDIFSSEGMEKEQTLTEAIQGLAETKLELRRKEQTIRQVNKQLACLEGEKESLCNNLQDAEKALRTVAKDKDILTSYIQSVDATLKKVKSDMGGRSKEQSLSKLLLNADFIPQDVGKAGPELIACQNLVGTFIEAQQQVTCRLRAMEGEMEDSRRHVTLLKQELSDAVRREHEQYEISPPTRDRYMGSHDDDIISPHDYTEGEFMTMREDSEISYNVSRGRSSKSPKKSDRSGQFSTPHRTSRNSGRQKAQR